MNGRFAKDKQKLQWAMQEAGITDIPLEVDNQGIWASADSEERLETLLKTVLNADDARKELHPFISNSLGVYKVLITKNYLDKLVVKQLPAQDDAKSAEFLGALTITSQPSPSQQLVFHRNAIINDWLQDWIEKECDFRMVMNYGLHIEFDGQRINIEANGKLSMHTSQYMIREFLYDTVTKLKEQFSKAFPNIGVSNFEYSDARIEREARARKMGMIRLESESSTVNPWIYSASLSLTFGKEFGPLPKMKEPSKLPEQKSKSAVKTRYSDTVSYDEAKKGINEAKGDPYEAIGIEQNAEPREIRKAYRKLAQAIHPDKNKDRNTKEVEALFKTLQSAYEKVYEAAIKKSSGLTL